PSALARRRGGPPAPATCPAPATPASPYRAPAPPAAGPPPGAGLRYLGPRTPCSCLLVFSFPTGPTPSGRVLMGPWCYTRRLGRRALPFRADQAKAVLLDYNRVRAAVTVIGLFHGRQVIEPADDIGGPETLASFYWLAVQLLDETHVAALVTPGFRDC